MKNKILTLVLFICGLAVSALTGCDSEEKAAVEYIIPVVNRCNEPFCFDDYFRKVKTVYLRSDNEYTAPTMISDIYFIDSYAFILEISDRRLSKIDLKKGKVVNQIRVKRNQCVLSGDKDHLYLLGFGNKNIITIYDLDLIPTDSLELKNVSVSSFSRIKNGFIFLNGRETGNRGKYVITNSRLTRAVSYKKVGAPYKPYKKNEPISIAFSEVFIKGSFGRILCYDNENQDGYLYDGEKLKRLFHIGTDVTDPEAVPLKNTQMIYSLKGNRLFHYYNEDFTDGVAYFDKDNNLVAQGPAYDSNKEGLFRYTYRQVGRKLVRIRMEKAEDRDKNPNNTTYAQIDFYRLK